MSKITFDQIPDVLAELRENQKCILNFIINNPSLKKEDEPSKEILLTLGQVIDYLRERHGLNLARQTIYCLKNDRKIPFIKPEGTKRLLFSSKQIDEWIQNGRQIKHLKE